MTFEIFVGSVEGPYHLQHNIPNQDAVAWHDENNMLIAAVADGAGSLKHSDVGSQDAVLAAIHSIYAAHKTVDFEKLPELGITAARSAQLRRENYKEYGSTLSLVILKESGEWTAGSVGDSFSIIHGADGDHELITGTPHGEFANITELLTSKDIHPRYASGDAASGFSLSSDGLENVSLRKNAAHPGFWNGIYAKAEDGSLSVHELFEWLNSLDKIIDDTTLLTAIKR